MLGNISGTSGHPPRSRSRVALYSHADGDRACPPRRTGVDSRRAQRGEPAAHRSWPPAGGTARRGCCRPSRSTRSSCRRWCGPARPPRRCSSRSVATRSSTTGWRRSATRCGTARRRRRRPRRTPSCAGVRPRPGGRASKAANRSASSSRASAPERPVPRRSRRRAQRGRPADLADRGAGSADRARSPTPARTR